MKLDSWVMEMEILCSYGSWNKKNKESCIFNAVRIETSISGLNTDLVWCWLSPFAFFPHSNWTNTCFLFLVEIPAASLSTELLSVGSCLVQGVLFPGGVGITGPGSVPSCCLAQCTALRITSYSVLVQGDNEPCPESRIAVLQGISMGVLEETSLWVALAVLLTKHPTTHLSVLLFFG